MPCPEQPFERRKIAPPNTFDERTIGRWDFALNVPSRRDVPTDRIVIATILAKKNGKREWKRHWVLGYQHHYMSRTTGTPG